MMASGLQLLYYLQIIWIYLLFSICFFFCFFPLFLWILEIFIGAVAIVYERKVINIVWTGMILKGRYCILEQAGDGGEGSVFMARDLELGTVWAVKEIPLSQKREAKLMRLLEHPALPRMVD